MVKIFLFGRFSVERDGQVLPPSVWKNTKTKSLLKILASERGRVFAADELIEYLWPDEELSLRSAASNLRSRVAELRKILEPQLARGEESRYILTKRGGYTLSDESDCWVDTEEFSQLEERGRRAHREGDFDEAIRSFEQAVSLYRGEYLAEDRYDEWALQTRERFRERFVEVLSLLADSLARRGQYRPALEYLERAVTESPLHETLYRQLMLYAFCAGDRARARRAYERCRAVLERELGERPSSQTEEIFRQIQAENLPGSVYPEPIAEKALLAVPAKIRHPPFVGRQHEWDQLRAALAKARSGSGRVVLIMGEAGVGKTRLGEEFLRWARSTEGAQTLCGRCYELESPLPFHLWVEALRQGLSKLQSADLTDVHPLWLAELSEILPELHLVFPDLPSGALPAEHRQYRLFETLWRVLSALARRHPPLLLLLDDLQWADSSSLDFLCYLIERFTDEPILILGTARSEELTPQHGVERVRHQGSRVGRLDEIVLHRLGEHEIHELVRSLADELEITADFGGRLYRESVGNPLFATAVLQALFENGAFVYDGSRWRLSDPSRIVLAPSAVQLLERRVKRASMAAQRILHVVACAVQIELEVLEAAWEGTPEELFAHLAELTSQGVLIERGGRYEFVHDKFREVVYNRLEEPRRIWLHRRIAQAIEHVYADPAAAGLAGQLAEHYERGGQPVQALEWIVKIVQECEKFYQNEEGLRWTARGFKILQTLQGRLSPQEYLSQKFELLSLQIQFQMQLGALSYVADGLSMLTDIVAQLKDDHYHARSCCLHAQYNQWLGRYSESLHHAQQALEFYQRGGTKVEQATGLYEVGLAHFYVGDYRRALQYYEQASIIFRDVRESRKLIDVLDSLGNAYTKLGECQKALFYYKQALDACEQINDIKSRSDLLNNRGVALRTLGRYQEALEHFQEACKTDQQVGNRVGLAFSLSNLGQVYRLLGIPDQALVYYHQAHEVFKALESSAEQGIMKRLIGSIYREQGELELARTYLEAALHYAHTSSARAEEAECLRELGELAYAQNDHDHALKLLERALQIGQELGLALTLARSWLALSKIHLDRRNYQGALQASEEAIKLVQEHEWAGEIVIHAHYYRYRALHALGRPEAADALRAAQAELLKTAHHITDDSLRQSFFALPLHRQITAAARKPLPTQHNP